VLGCIITTCDDITVNMRILVFSCFSLISFSFRNVLTVKGNDEQKRGPFFLFTQLSLIAFLFSSVGTAAACIPSLQTHQLTDHIFIFLSLESSIHHCLYQTASILLLHRLTVLTHAITNVCKRMCILLAAQLFVTGEMPLTPIAWVGMISTLFGLVIFSIWPHVVASLRSSVL